MGNTGNFCSLDSRPRQVHSMSNRPKLGPQYQKAPIQSQRFGQPLFTRKKDTLYNFMMSVRHDGALQQISVDLPILRQLVDCILHPNFDLQIQSKTIIDIFDMADHTQVLVAAQHRKTKQEFSVKVYPFTAYSEHVFRKGLYEIFMHSLVGGYGRGVVNLLEYFVVDRGGGQRALVFLYEPVETSLANMIEFRNQTRMHWPEVEQIYIMRSILGGYETLNSKNIYHRDLRPSRIYYSKVKKEYLIGNLEEARVVMAVDLQQNALLTPRGVPFFNAQNVNQILKRGDKLGHYNALQNDYIFLKKLMLYLNNTNYQDTHDFISNQTLKSLYQQLHTLTPIPEIMRSIRTLDYKSYDSGLAQRVQMHLCDRNSKTNKSILLNTLFSLHQNEQFSKLAHLQIQSNLQTGKPLLNAPLFKRLGEYYAGSGANSQDYFINALLLYLRNSVYSRKMGFLDRAVDDLHQAKVCDGYVTDLAYKVGYLRELAVVRAMLGDVGEANEIVNMALKKAAERGVPVMQELDLLLAKGEIAAYTHDPEEGERFLKFGLGLCEDTQYFEDRDVQTEYKSKFLTLLAMNYFDAFMAPQPGQHPQKRSKHLAKAQSLAISALQLRQQLPSKGIDLSNLLYLLGKIYSARNDFYLSKKSFIRSLQYRLSYKQEINPMLVAEAFYEVATCHRMLDELQEAERSYSSALRICSAIPKARRMAMMCRGYLGVVLIRQGRVAEGMAEVQAGEQGLAEMSGGAGGGGPEVMMLRQEVQRAMPIGTQIQNADAQIRQTMGPAPGSQINMQSQVNLQSQVNIPQMNPMTTTTTTTTVITPHQMQQSITQPIQPIHPMHPPPPGHPSGVHIPPFHVPPIHAPAIPPFHVPPIHVPPLSNSELKHSQQATYIPQQPQQNWTREVVEVVQESQVRPAAGFGGGGSGSDLNMSRERQQQQQQQTSNIWRNQQQNYNSKERIEEVEEVYVSGTRGNDQYNQSGYRNAGGDAGGGGFHQSSYSPSPPHQQQPQNLIQSRVMQLQRPSQITPPQQPPPPSSQPDVMISSFRNAGSQSLPYPPPPLRNNPYNDYQSTPPPNFADAFKGITPGASGSQLKNYPSEMRKPREIEILDQRMPGPQGTSQHTITITERQGSQLRGSRTIVINQGGQQGMSNISIQQPQQQQQSSHIFGPSAMQNSGIGPAGTNNSNTSNQPSQLAETSIIRESQPIRIPSHIRQQTFQQATSQTYIPPPSTPRPLNSNGAMATSSFVRGHPGQPGHLGQPVQT